MAPGKGEKGFCVFGRGVFLLTGCGLGVVGYTFHEVSTYDKNLYNLRLS